MESGIHWENIALFGYECYSSAIKSADPTRIVPSWQELTEGERQAWISATHEITEVFATAVLA